MIPRLLRYLAALNAGIVTSLALASPTWAVGLEELKRRKSTGSSVGGVLGTVCCLFVVVLIAAGIGIGVLISRRRR